MCYMCTGPPHGGLGIERILGQGVTLVFQESPYFQTLLTRIKSTFGWNEAGVVVGMEGRSDVGLGSKVHALLMSISCDDDWDMYKEVVFASQVRSLEVVMEMTIVDEDMQKNVDVMNNSMDVLESAVKLSQAPPPNGGATVPRGH